METGTGEVVVRDLSAAQQDYLDALASRVRTEHRRSRDAIGGAVDAYFAIGQCLLEAREALVSNEAFGAWFRSCEFGFTQQWARTLRAAAESEPAVRSALQSQLCNGGTVRRPFLTG